MRPLAVTSRVTVVLALLLALLGAVTLPGRAGTAQGDTITVSVTAYDYTPADDPAGGTAFPQPFSYGQSLPAMQGGLTPAAPGSRTILVFAADGPIIGQGTIGPANSVEIEIPAQDYFIITDQDTGSGSYVAPGSESPGYWNVVANRELLGEVAGPPAVVTVTPAPSAPTSEPTSEPTAETSRRPESGVPGQGYPVNVFLCDTDPGPWSPFSARPPGGGCEPADGIGVTVTIEDGTEVGSCVTQNGTCWITGLPGGPDTPLIFTEDVSTVPQGYAPRENPVTDINQTEFAFSAIFNIRTDATGQEPGAAPGADASLMPETDGSRVAIFAGDCDGDLAGAEPVATLTNVRPLGGDPRGADDVPAAETSFTTLDLPLDDILAEDHVLVVFDEDDDTVALACGGIGGPVTEDGELVFGLAAVDESRFSGVVYLVADGDQTQASVFVAEDLSAEPADESPAA